MQQHTSRLDRAGRTNLPDEQLRRMGLRPGDEIVLRETADGWIVQPLDPPLRRLYVEPTSACNLDCRICMRRSWGEPAGFMPMPTYRRLVSGLRAMPTLAKVSFWGLGEPLLHPDIVEMLALARGLGAHTELISNGRLLDRSMADALVAAGLDTLVLSIDNMSVDGGPAEGCTGAKTGSDLRAVQENVRALHSARWTKRTTKPEIGLEFVVTRHNARRLPDLRRLAWEMGARFVLVTHLLPYSEDTRDDIAYWLAVDSPGRPVHSSAIRLPPVLPPLEARPEYLQPALELLGHTGSPGTSPQDACVAGGYCRFVHEGSAAVSWDGAVSPCIPLMHSHTCYVLGRRKSMQRCTLGNVNQQDIAAIWSSPEFMQLRSRVLRFEFAPCAVCGGCELAESNEEDCHGNAFPVCGDCLWARGVIQCP